MPMALRRILFPRFVRRPVRRLAKSPFGRLVAHFLARMVRGGQDSASTEFDLRAGGLLGLLAAPGVFLCFLLLDKYSSFLSWMRGHGQDDLLLSSIPDKYLFLSLAMAVAGIVTVLKWDQVVPDSQDYLNLAPLPIRSRRILLANAAAILIAVVVVALDVNAAPVALFPLFVTAAGHTTLFAFFQFAAVHLLCVLLASFFSICAVFALLGTLSAVLPREAFRACSSLVRGILLVALITLLMSGFAGTTIVRSLQHSPDSALRFLPPLWYLGLYQSLQHRGPAALTALARTGLLAAGAAFLLMAVSYGLSYRRTFAASTESGRRPSEQRILRVVLGVLDLFAPRSPGFARACHRFAVRALVRNETHRLAIAVALGLGYLVAFQSATGGAPLEAPLAAVFLLVLGLRLAFELPAGVSASWVFRAILDPRENETLPVARRLIMTFVASFVLAPAFAVACWQIGLAGAAVQALYLAAASLCLVEIQFAGYRKLPLTCPMPGFRDNLPMLCLIQFLGFALFTGVGAGLERWILRMPLRLLVVPAAMAGAWYWNRRRRADAREAGELEEGLTFDNIPVRTVEKLNLSDGF